MFLLQDFNQDVMHVYTIPAQSLDTIKEWLTQVKIKYYETKTNLAWRNILKRIMDDPQGFIEDGGWKFLDMDVRIDCAMMYYKSCTDIKQGSSCDMLSMI